MKKRILIPAIITLCLFLLAACQCEHKWVDATCTTVKTCSKCEETEGEALGHSWQEASCVAAKTCTVCGITDGEALPHTWIDANYQVPKTCSICGSTEGEPMTAYFEEHNLTIRSLKDVHRATYITSCGNNPEKTTNASISITNTRTFESDEKHPAKEGYEWRAADVSITFSDKNAQEYGFSWAWITTTYHSQSQQFNKEDSSGLFTVNYNGIDYTECDSSIENEKENGWKVSYITTGNETKMEASFEIQFEVFFCVPTGYDGAILGFIDGNATPTEEQYLHELANKYSVFFRFDY